ncbi:MAG: histidine kinase [Geobacter sp.]|nr:MAG: histidine kinase [Geobacter sp.]
MTGYSQDRLCREIIDGCSEAVIFSDREGIIRLWNNGAEKLFGFSREEAIGQSLDIIIPDKLRGRHWDGYHRVMGTGETRYATELLTAPALCKDGRRLSTEFSMVLVRDDDGTVQGAAAVIRDVTVRWEREKTLKERLAVLETRGVQATSA